MPGYTAPMQIPYPTPGDTLRDAVSTIPAAAATKVNDLLAALQGVAAANVALVHSSSFNPTGTFPTTAFRRAGMVTVVMGADKNGWGGGETVATLPVGYRPAFNVYAFGLRTSDAGPIPLLITSGGLIQTVTASPVGSGGLKGHFTIAV